MAETKPVRVVHYVNQFFAGIGGEDKAGTAPLTMEGSIGPGRLLEQSSGGAIQVVGTVVCGDNFFVEDTASALETILEYVRSYQPEGFIAGPAFAAGRYGEACTAVCQAVKEKLGIPVITGLAPESPSVEENRRKFPILRTKNTAADMKNSMPQMGSILLQLVRGEDLTPDEMEKLYPRGFKKNIVVEVNAAERSIRMALAKFKGEPWQTEVTMVLQESVAPAPPAVQEKGIRIALVTDGGLVLKGNPEGMVGARSRRYCRIGIESWNRLEAEQVEIKHNGYDNRYVAEEPNRLLPLDALRELEQAEDVRIHPYIYSTAGVSTAIDDAATMGRGIAEELIKAGVQAAILTST
jgi:glycine reductase